jgi:hypothetical protein
MKNLLVVIALMLLVGCNKGSGKINSSSPQTNSSTPQTESSSPQTKEEMLAQIDALTKARHANDQPAELPIKVLSVAWKGPYAGLWQPTFVVRNDGPTTQLVSIDYQVFDGEVLVGSGVLFFADGIPGNTIAKEDGMHVNSETRPTKLTVVKISWKD